MNKPNPFFHRGPIRDRAYFFGREYETGQALSLLGNGQSVSLVGQRRIGKSSLLFHIADPEVFGQNGLSSKGHLFVYIDCGGLRGLDLAGPFPLFLQVAGFHAFELGRAKGSELSDEDFPAPSGSPVRAGIRFRVELSSAYQKVMWGVHAKRDLSFIVCV